MTLHFITVTKLHKVHVWICALTFFTAPLNFLFLGFLKDLNSKYGLERIKFLANHGIKLFKDRENLRRSKFKFGHAWRALKSLLVGHQDYKKYIPSHERQTYAYLILSICAWFSFNFLASSVISATVIRTRKNV